MRTPIIAGNWKMFKTIAEAKAFAEEVKAGNSTSGVQKSFARHLQLWLP